MITIISTPKKKLVHIRCTGKVRHKDYLKVLIPTLDKKIKSAGSLRIVFDLREMKKIEGRAIWDDYKFGIHHLKDIERMVTIGDQWWIGLIMKVCKLFFRIRLKHFHSSQYEQALRWINMKK